MSKIFKAMMKEEWRSHSIIFGNKTFAFFPFLLAILSFAISFSLPVLTSVLPARQISLIAHYIFVIFGISVGAFGLLAREVMNRRFGQESMIAYSSRTLPVSEKKVFFYFFVKDVIYYFLLWILPFITGVTLAFPLLSISLSYFPLLLLTLTLSFLIGLSTVFFLSTVYAHSNALLIVILASLGVIGLIKLSYFDFDSLVLLPSFSFFLNPELDSLGLSSFLVVVPSILSIAFLKVDYPKKKRRFKNYLNTLAERLSFLENSHFIAKDFLDFKRSEGGLGKLIFSFLFPLLFIWALLSVFSKFLSINFLPIFAILLGVVSSSIYNWLTEFDLFDSYSFLPVKVSTLLKSKIRSYFLINLVSVSILISASLWVNQPADFFPALFTFYSVSSYTLAITVYIAGLSPNLLLYNPLILLKFIGSIAPVLVLLILLSLLNPLYLILSPILIIGSFYIIKRSYSKWDKIDQPSF